MADDFNREALDNWEAGSRNGDRLLRVSAWLTHFSYKPNFQFRVRDAQGRVAEHAGVWLDVVMYVPDAYRRNHPPVEFEGPYYRDLGPDPRLPVRHQVSEMGWYHQNLDLVPVQGSWIMPDYVTASPRAFFDYLKHIVSNMEDHERDEWFRVDGVAMFDPHADHPPREKWFDAEGLTGKLSKPIVGD